MRIQPVLGSRYLPVAAIAIAYPLAGSVLGGNYNSTLLVTAGIVALAGIGLDVCIGGAGLLVFSSPAFMLIGAMATAKVTTALSPWGGAEWSPLLGMLLGICVTLAAAAVVSLVTLRLSGLGLGLVTLFLLFAEATIVENVGSLGGATGLIGVPSFQVGSYVFDTPQRTLALLAGCLLVAGFLGIRYLSSDIGRELAAIRQDEIAAAASGIRVARRKIEAFVLGSVPASVSGSLLAHQLHFASPDVFPLSLLLDILLMVYIGGVGTVWGVMLGAPIVEITANQLDQVGNWGLAIQGAVFVVVLVLLPGGLASLGRLLRSSGPERRDAMPLTAPPPPRTQPALRLSTAGVTHPTLLELERVERRFGGVRAVNGVSLVVPSGETYALLGPNGAGKTTLFNLISGALRPTGGHIRLKGSDVTLWSSAAMAGAGVTRTFQNVRLFSGLSVLDNVLVGTGASSREGLLSAWLPGSGRGRDQALQACELFGLLDILDVPVDSLPIGIQRRVEMARAMARQPQLLLLDEPASGLSSPERDALQQVLRRVAETDITMIIVEHDISFVSGLATRGMVLENGTVIFDGPLGELLSHPDVITAYLGEALEAEGA